MNALSLIVFAVALAMASAGVIGLVGSSDHGAALQGPGSETVIVGPDGSHIATGTHGGAVIAPGVHGGAISAGIVPGLVGIGGVGHIGGLGGIGLGGIGLGGIGLGGVGLVGSGLEGQYVPSGLEQLYDDGSYRGEHNLGGGDDYDDGGH